MSDFNIRTLEQLIRQQTDLGVGIKRKRFRQNKFIAIEELKHWIEEKKELIYTREEGCYTEEKRFMIWATELLNRLT